MNRTEFLSALQDGLRSLSEAERKQVVYYYEELISDGTENGKSEEECISSFQPPEVIAAQILHEYRALPQQPAPNGPNCYMPIAPGHAVSIEARNIRVVVQSADISTPRIWFTPYKRDVVTTEERDGTFYFFHRTKLPGWAWSDLLRGPHEILLELPRNFAGELYVKTSNAALCATGLAQLASGSFTSQNGKLTLEHITCGSFTARTSNAGIVLTNIQGETACAVTHNARITACGCTFSEECTLTTSNAQLRLEQMDCPHLTLKTSNAAVIGTMRGDLRDFAIRSHTSNASNNLPPEFVFPEQTRSLNVKTSNGRIDLQFTR